MSRSRPSELSFNKPEDLVRIEGVEVSGDFTTPKQRARALAAIKSKGDVSENILYIRKVNKINKRSRHQERVFIITDRALYNVKPDNFSKCKRRIELNQIACVISSKSSYEFVVHVPSEKDYRVTCIYKKELMNVLKHVMLRIYDRSLLVVVIDAPELRKEVISVETESSMVRQVFGHLANEKAMREPTVEERDEQDETTIDMLSKPHEDKVGMSDFVLLKLLGKGAFGKVVKVQKTSDGKVYAMKIIRKAVVYRQQKVESTIAERVILSAFENPFIMTLKYAFQSASKLYLVMDYYPGGELFEHLKYQKRFSEEQARFIIAELAMAIGHLHSLNFIYRDLKPENVLMAADGHVCLTDFGLSKELDPATLESNTFCGTPDYIGPEILLSLPYTAAVDWWSLGIMTYELIIGITPFYSPNLNEMYRKIKMAKPKFPGWVSPECKDFITQLLEKDPADRLGSQGDDVGGLIHHPWFASIDFGKLLNKELQPPYNPEFMDDAQHLISLSGGRTDEPVIDSVVPDDILREISSKDPFTNFTFNASGRNMRLSLTQRNMDDDSDDED